MPTIATNLGNTRERARQLRFEPAGAITAVNVQKAIEQVATTPQGINPTAVTFAASPYAVLPTDTVLYVDTSGGAVSITLPAMADRNGVPLEIKDVSGNASTNNISLTGQSVDGLTPYVINSDFGGIRLYPRTASYTVAP